MDQKVLSNLKTPNEDSHSTLKAAGAMGAATFLSRIMGLVREQVFAYLFGAGNATDAFNIAFRIPNLLRDLFAEGAMSASLVPTFTRTRIEHGDRAAWRVAGLVFRVLFGFVGLLAVLGIYFAPKLVGVYAKAYQAVPGKFELTVKMTQVIFPFFPLVAVAAAFMGILNACGVFFIPAFSSALFNVGSVVAGASLAVLFQHFPNFGFQPIEGMAIGVVVGGLVQATSQWPSLRRQGFVWVGRSAGEPPWYRNPALKKMLWLMIPGTIGLAATQVNVLVNSVLATSQGAGAVSWLNYAFRLMQFPIGVFGVSLASATLPKVSKLWVQKDFKGTEAAISQSIRQVIAINLPASAGLAFLSVPIIQLIFEHGRFRPEDTHATALALVAYSVGLTAYSAVKVLVPAFYAMGDTRIPVISSVLAVALNIAINLVTVKTFGYWGLAMGTSLMAILNALFLLYAARLILRRAGGDLHLAPIFGATFKNLVIALLMGVATWGTLRGLELAVPQVLPWKILDRAWRVGLGVGEGALLVVVLSKLLKAQDTLTALELLSSKFRKRLKPKGSQ